MNRQQIEEMVRNVLQDMAAGEQTNKLAASASPASAPPSAAGEINLDVPDITAVNLQETLLVENPHNREAYLDMMQANPARLGVGRAGPRQNVQTLLRFRADNAGAMDAVLTDVSEETIKEMGLLSVKSSAPDRAEFLMDPGKGRVFDEENAKIIRDNCKANPKVQIIVCDGLSSTAVENNIRDVLPALLQGLRGNGLDVGTNIFVKFGRVGIMDAICDILHPEVTVNFIGERPGLLTNESLSCYMTYKGYPGMAENMRTVVSNIYANGTPPSEAGAHIADLVKKMIELKTSGMSLK